MKFKKISKTDITPERATKFSAGFDLYSREKVKIKYGETEKIHTGIIFEIPEGMVGLIFARSGLATKNGIRPANCVGVIDSDYRGEIIVPLYNDSFNDYQIYDGTRIAQIIFVPYYMGNIEESYDLSETERGTGGFGSTGE